VVTDTGATADMLDQAQRAWPEVTDRKELLLRLAALGRDAIEARDAEQSARQRQAAQREALARIASRVDVDALLGDEAWR
jgi:isopropylmalate/homocitrate/citramalate synthase